MAASLTAEINTSHRELQPLCETHLEQSTFHFFFAGESFQPMNWAQHRCRVVTVLLSLGFPIGKNCA